MNLVAKIKLPGRRTPATAFLKSRTQIPRYTSTTPEGLAKEIAMRAFNLYGDFDPATGAHFRKHGMPDDYVAYISALEAINVSRGFSAALPVLNTKAKPNERCSNPEPRSD